MIKKQAESAKSAQTLAGNNGSPNIGNIFKKFFNKSVSNERKSFFTLLQSDPIIMEQIKKIRNRLLRAWDKKPVKTMLVTSALPGEGKTLISSSLAINIALAFVGSKRHVLLVDADLRNPSIHKTFNIQSAGLQSFLTKGGNLSDLVRKTDIPNLSVLPAEKCLEKAADLLSTENVKLFIQEASALYEDCLIIFDSVPVQLVSESILLADAVDTILLVVKSGETGKKLIRNTVDLLGREKISGIILNFHQQSSRLNHSYYGRYYNYYYNPSKK